MTDFTQKALETLRPLVGSKAKEETATDDDAFLALRFKDLALDSLEKMELVMKIEEEFNVALDEEDVLACDKISDLVRLIEQSH